MIELDPQIHLIIISWMPLHMLLKFGSFLAVLDLLKNLFVQMPDTISGQSEVSSHISYMGSHKV